MDIRYSVLGFVMVIERSQVRVLINAYLLMELSSPYIDLSLHLIEKKNHYIDNCALDHTINWGPVLSLVIGYTHCDGQILRIPLLT